MHRATLSLNAYSQNAANYPASSQESAASVYNIPDISYDAIIAKLDRLPEKSFVNRLRELKVQSEQFFHNQYEQGYNEENLEMETSRLAASLREYEGGKYVALANLVKELSNKHKVEANHFLQRESLNTNNFAGGGRRRTIKKLRGRRRHNRTLTKRRRTLRRK